MTQPDPGRWKYTGGPDPSIAYDRNAVPRVWLDPDADDDSEDGEPDCFMDQAIFPVQPTQMG